MFVGDVALKDVGLGVDPENTSRVVVVDIVGVEATFCRYFPRDDATAPRFRNKSPKMMSEFWKAFVVLLFFSYPSIRRPVSRSLTA